MGQALYRIYRSKKLSEIVGQEHITQALENALKQGLVSHAYLFTGPRGVGKTSIARILAHEINDLPYEDDATHLDIIEIDAASNRRIDEIRNLRDKVHIAPSNAKFKVYIIDEVHMLTREAFNALLKTLEEPPAHAVFILATTEAHKLPETIVSRTQRFTFKPVEQTKVVAHLRSIAKQEKITIDDEALALIAAHGEGSFRDSISLLDQMRNTKGKVTAGDVEAVLGIAPAALIEQLLQALSDYDGGSVLRQLQQLRIQGAEAAQIAKQLSELLRERFIANEVALSHNQTIHLLTKLIDVPSSADPQIYLEVILLDIALSQRETPASVPPVPTAPTPKVSKSAPAKTSAVVKTVSAATSTVEQVTHTPKKALQSAPKQEATSPQLAEKSAATETKGEILDAAAWPQVLNTIKQKYNTLYGILRVAEPHFDPGLVTLKVGYAFHQKRLNENANKKIIAETIEAVSNTPVQITCILGKAKPKPAEAEGEIVHAIATIDSSAAAITKKPDGKPGDYYVVEAEKASTKPLDAISNIFGGGELLES